MLNKKTVTAIQRACYHLCAVVRSSIDGGTIESIRTYWKDGSEIVPAQVGLYENKEPESPGVAQRSVKDKGTYHLYNFRLYRPEGWPESEMNVDAREFEDRP